MNNKLELFVICEDKSFYDKKMLNNFEKILDKTWGNRYDMDG